MTVWVVVWVVLMMFWILGGGWVSYNGPNATPLYFGGYVLIPWLCVLLLGLFVLGGLPHGTGGAAH